ncbi:DUF1523 family protein [Pseudohalocynthiibacter aestuariivivens]|uniref:DUF1523 family protein n=1 Tax=Pseudohalocynthiibacter aestuariivivens TaxID=1591409 RepID=A0ABV5JCF5_9RHOB|nr:MULTISPECIES: DUF1523 family protein [Pseudohalocynthiibacter]MBS9715663.1 DUF1523 family protein [Pseudohalocynthiibacter aestuariivivens]MCK0101276.1 DUF1523 family protein [Pseudohalocynthiibacter sp. F2068]
MRYIKWGIFLLLALLTFGFFHYTLPQHDVVRIVDTEVRRVDFGENSIFWASPDTGTDTAANRDVRFINAVYENGRVMVYRNEDTGWGWPPYFKLDSSNLQTEARDLASTSAAPQWVVIRHYGWRNEFMTIYPNAVSVRAIAGPDVQIIPWLNIIILTLLVLFIFWLWRVWRRFKERRIDPVLDDAAEAWDSVDERADAARDSARGFWGRMMAWIGTWRSKPRE